MSIIVNIYYTMKVERYVSDEDGIPEMDRQFIKE